MHEAAQAEAYEGKNQEQLSKAGRWIHLDLEPWLESEEGPNWNPTRLSWTFTAKQQFWLLFAKQHKTSRLWPDHSWDWAI